MIGPSMVMIATLSVASCECEKYFSWICGSFCIYERYALYVPMAKIKAMMNRIHGSRALQRPIHPPCSNTTRTGLSESTLRSGCNGDGTDDMLGSFSF